MLSTVAQFPLCFRSYFSFMQGIYAPEAVCKIASSLSYSTLLLCDVNGFFGYMDYKEHALVNSLRPLAGTEIHYNEKYYFHLLCLNQKGFNEANIFLSRLQQAIDLKEDNFDPVIEFISQNFSSVYILSNRSDILERLQQHRKPNLYAAIFYKQPFRPLVSWAQKNSIPLFALTKAMFTNESDKNFYILLRAIDQSKRYNDIHENEKLTAANCFPAKQDIQAFYSAVPEAIANALLFSKNSEIHLTDQNFIFPDFQGLSESSSFKKLKSLCINGILRRYGNKNEAISQRLNYELDIILRKGFTSYFLVVHDIAQRFPRTCGRGSSAASIVSYLLGITHVDPLKYDLFFERFLNDGRNDPPDIDIDFPWDERDAALNYVFTKYKGHAAMVANHIRFRYRSAIREAAKAFGVNDIEIKRLQKAWKYDKYSSIPHHITAAVQRLLNFPRHLGTHPGGLVITPHKIQSYCHTHLSKTGYPTLAWEKDAVEAAGLVKIDLLGNRSLSVLRDTMDLVNERKYKAYNWEQFQPMNDASTRKMIEKGDTLGVFYVESPATRLLLKKMGSGTYEDLIIASSIIRPAANAYINEFIRRLKGAAWPPLHPIVEKVLFETKGIMVYQEDISRIALALLNFSTSEADSFRKILSKQSPLLPMYKKLFFQRGFEKKIENETLQALWNGFLSFTGYSFCKAHSASYALLSYKLAYMKNYYPQEFFISVINNHGGFYSTQTYINAVRRSGFRIKGSDINKSEWKYTAENTSIRMGFCQLSGINKFLIERVITERQSSGVFTSLFNFLQRCSPHSADLRVLIRSGSLDSICQPFTRPQVFWLASQKCDDFFLQEIIPSCITDYSHKTKLFDELLMTKLIYSCHPANLFLDRAAILQNKFKNIPLIRSQQLQNSIGYRISIAATINAAKEVLTTGKTLMTFLSFEDEEGCFEAVAFPATYKKLLFTLEQGFAFFIIGRVQIEFGTAYINIEQLYTLNKINNRNYLNIA